MILSIVHLAVTSALFGLIWVIQLVKYPGFRFLSEKDFIEYHKHHTRSITWLALPLMVTELALAIVLFIQSGCAWERLVPLFLVVDIWVSTFLFQVPMHNILSGKKDDKLIEKLIKSNWVRTILWTVELGWLLCFCVNT